MVRRFIQIQGIALILVFLLFILIWAEPDTTYINSDSMDIYILGEKATVYILNTNIKTPGSAFIIGKDSITLDLNGYTVEFDTNSQNARSGILIPPSYDPTPYGWQGYDEVPESCYTGADTFMVKNGTINYGGNASADENYIVRCKEATNGLFIRNLKGFFGGQDGQGIFSSENRNVEVVACTLQGEVMVHTNRHDPHAGIHITAMLGGKVVVESCYVYGYGQFGIITKSKKSYPITQAEVAYNQSNLHGTTTNPYQYVVSGFSKENQGINLLFHHNRVIANGDISCRGLNIEGVDASFEGVDGGKFYSNYLELKEHGNVEYGIDGWTHCFRMRDDGVGTKKNFNNEFYNDTFVVNGYYVSADTHGGGWGVRISNSATLTEAEANIFHDNVFIANSQDTHLVCATYCVGFENHTKYSNTLFYDNEFTSNSNFFQVSHEGGDSATFRSNTFALGADTTHYNTFYWYNFKEGADGDNDAIGHIFLDNTIGAGVDFKDMYLHTYNPRPRSYYLQWYANVNVRDSLDQNLVGASVTGYDESDGLQDSAVTGADGNVQLALSEYYFYTSGLAADSTYTYYSPYKIIATKDGIADTVLNITMDTTVVESLQLKTQTGVSTKYFKAKK